MSAISKEAPSSCSGLDAISKESVENPNILFYCPIIHVTLEGAEIKCGVSVITRTRARNLLDRLRGQPEYTTYVNHANQAACMRTRELHEIYSRHSE